MMRFIHLSILIIFSISCANDSIKTIESTKNSPKTEEKVKAPVVEINPTKPEPKIIEISNTDKVNTYCDKIETYFKKYKWGASNCHNTQWHHVRDSHWGNPIIWKVFGDEEELENITQNTTLILCGVHGDEITPIKFCFDILEDLKKNPEIVKDKLVIVAPIVTPDSFFRKYPTRTNGRGVDVNRNFPTKDWDKNALKLWKARYKKDKRRYPGNRSLSEQETIFQVNIINRYKPNKIISVHAPLTLLDYDGPEHPESDGAMQLLIQMSDKAGKYKINNYPFFTGSLGNWAGNERGIPTYTIELPNSDWTKTKKFYNTFRNAIHHAIDHELNKKSHDTQEKKLEDKKVSENNSQDEVIL